MRTPACVLALLIAAAQPAAAQVTFRDAADRDAFRYWVVLLADRQFYHPTPDVTDCAGLIRHAVREALRTTTPGWRQRLALPVAVAGPAVEARAKTVDGGLALFRVTSETPARYAEFADARTLVRLNAVPAGRDVDALRPGDLLYFRQDARRAPDHLMLFIGRSAFEAEGDDWIVYHTGPSAGDAEAAAEPGEVRKVRLGDLLQHPAPRWRPSPMNPNFVGIYRLRLFAP